MRRVLLFPIYWHFEWCQRGLIVGLTASLHEDGLYRDYFLLGLPKWLLRR